jgi:hypothetical protein
MREYDVCGAWGMGVIREKGDMDMSFLQKVEDNVP